MSRLVCWLHQRVWQIVQETKGGVRISLREVDCAFAADILLFQVNLIAVALIHDTMQCVDSSFFSSWLLCDAPCDYRVLKSSLQELLARLRLHNERHAFCQNACHACHKTFTDCFLGLQGQIWGGGGKAITTGDFSLRIVIHRCTLRH